MKSIRTALIAPFVALMLLALSACGAPAGTPTASDLPLKTATVGLTYIPNIQFSPFYLADSRGYFTEQGAEVELRHHGAQEGLFTALLAGEEDFVVAGAGEMMQARSEGADLVAIASYYREYPVRMIVPADSGVEQRADLKGARIGIPGRFGESWFALQVFLDQAGLTEQDVTIVEIGYTPVAALTTGKVDAVVGYVNNDAVQFEQAGFSVRTLPVADEVPLVSASLITTREYAETHPDIARLIVAAMLRGIDAAADDPEATVDASVAYIPNLTTAEAKSAALATLKATVPLFVADGGATGLLDERRFTDMARFMLDRRLISAPVDGPSSMTNDYVAK